ncbi:MAG TPA: Crp/Fnr family transcriptional regulator [Nitrospirae bacterium]|nr:cAMP receptor protein [bacterium BMS3Abin06]HDH11336.1 Crp/Fnr family transcriptional regulator [Nitrospirota bacterium]HDZ02651.1 Crp/Fnr family transcriptional regulator [Nitrospirota bacterium]
MKSDSPFYENTLKALKQSELFGGLKETVIQDMLLMFRRQTWLRKSIVMQPEQTVKEFFVIISGRVKVTRVNPDTGKEFILFLLGPGDGFDVISLLNSKEHNVSFVAMDDLETLSAPFTTVHDWIERHPEFNKAFLPYLGKQIRLISNLAFDLALYDTSTRLMKLFLQHTVQSNPRPRLNLINDLSNEELACMIGSVRVVVSRHVQELKKEGIITARRGHLEVKELHTLVEKIEEHLALKDKR